jgi:ABC-type dipeptide/oligopeptide/nickel transport system permease subunit
MKKGWKLFWRIILCTIFAVLMARFANTFGVFEPIQADTYSPFIIFSILGTVVITCFGFIRMDTQADMTPPRWALPLFGSAGFGVYASIKAGIMTGSAEAMTKTLFTSAVCSILGVIVGMIAGILVMGLMYGIEQLYMPDKFKKK